ncbi:ribonuclease H2, subunit C [Mycena pura]|uniref:Ribonuclease H2, subunit C n=1 Tax=Mycena pura TaxID=153505 RepID=A0AAD6YW84_9AGAR|nr:ribonuclease H2, subunit C [Mycena pura]
MAPTLSIDPISSLDSLPNAVPNLMPFHVDHNGPAPISTYFLVEAASEHIAQPPPALPAVVGPADEPLPTECQDSLSETVADPPVLPKTSFSRRVTDATTRFIATFRGRTVHGLKVQLPPGYTGVVMAGGGAPRSAHAAGESNAKAKAQRAAKAKPKSRGNRTTRSVARADEEDEMDIDGDEKDRGVGCTRALLPAARFSSFVLWHPDMPVDPGRDEYARTLTEWIRLANEVHRVEE